MSEKKEPMSLNQRHSRLLYDLSSASHSKSKPIADVVESKHKLEGRRRLCKAGLPSYSDSEADAPNFSEIADFDSPSPAETRLKVKKEDSGYVESIVNDFTSHPEMRAGIKKEVIFSSSELLDGKKNSASCNEVIASADDDFTSKPEGEKPLKVKLEGRRRLCKVQSEDDHEDVDVHPNFSAVTDFDSPTPVKYLVSETTNDGGNEIRDILNDLSSRLEILSIEKRGRPNKVSSSSVFNEGSNRLKMETLSEDTSDPSFSLTLDQSNSSSEASNQLRADKVQSNAESVSSDGHDEKSDSDDCVVTSGHKFVKKVESRHGKFKRESDDSDVVHIKDDNRDNYVPRDEISFTLTGPNSTYKLPDKIAHMLYPHQREGLKWLWSLHCRGKGGILGDDMGLGKTMQICGFLAGLFHSCLIKRVMIVAPKTLLPHWIKELATVGLSEKTREYFGTCAKARQYELQYILQDKGVLLTTYDIVRNNAKSLRGDYYFHDDRDEDEVTWDYMILDEGHLIKNPSTQRAKSLLEIPSAHRIIISGTPLQNNLKELWALFNFCCPELLGDKNCFKTKYEAAILRGNDKNASDRDKRVGSAVAQDLRTCIQPYFLRRLKSEVFREDDATSIVKLSKKNEIIVWLRLTGVQRRIYEAFLKSELVLSAFDGSPLAALTILKKICDHPLLLTKRAAEDVLEGMESVLNKEDHGVAEKLAMHIADVAERFDFVENHDDVSCKISFILSLLDNLIPDGHNVLIFSQTRKMLNLIQDSLASRGYAFLRIDGTTKAADRLKIVNDFQEGMIAPIFLLTSQVGGLGLTLTKADRVIVVDPAWNPSTDNQSVDRAYRIGQKKDVVVYRLMTCGTVEEKIYRKQIYKGGLFKSATEHKEQIRYFSQQDLRELFSLPKQGFDVSLTQQQLHEEHDSEHTMDASLKGHMEFLETLGIAGISHHSLLFSKTAPVSVLQEDELARIKQSTFVGNSSTYSSRESDIDGAQFAFNPKDVNLQKKNLPQNTARKLTESEIKERIKRLSQVFSNKVMVSNLPDKGDKLQKQISELNLELKKIHMERRSEKETINLDDISGEFNRVLNV